MVSMLDSVRAGTVECCGFAGCTGGEGLASMLIFVRIHQSTQSTQSVLLSGATVFASRINFRTHWYEMCRSSAC